MSLSSYQKENFTLRELGNLLGGEVLGEETLRISDLTLSSTELDNPVQTIFCAVRGTRIDGHNFIGEVTKKGVRAALVSDRSALCGISGIVVSDTRKSISRLCSILTGEASKKLSVIGITGTNGKTTTNWIIQKVLSQLGYPCSRLGTLGYEIGGQRGETGLTTPDAYNLHRFLRASLDAGMKGAVLEVSSHALDQFRADDVSLDVAVFTNLTRDHLDYHKDFESYFTAKRRLFELLVSGCKSPKGAIINTDDIYGARLHKEFSGVRDLSYGLTGTPKILIRDLSQSFSGLRFEIHFEGINYRVETELIGVHNAQNLAAAFGSCIALGFKPKEVVRAFSAIPQVPGRLESVRVGVQQKFGVFVDYAHTPDALDRVIGTLKPLTKGDLWVIFGCGGDRDRGKRPEMRRIALAGGARMVVTSDNPRSEDPESIIQEILAGASSADLSHILVEVDRRKAIHSTVAQLRDGDLLLIAGKGHEDYQITGLTKDHFSDVEEAVQAIRVIFKSLQ